MKSTEFRLVVECCRRAFPDGLETFRPALAESVDWQRVLRLARFHRVQGLVWKSLAAADAGPPAEVAQALAGDATEIAASNLRAAVESRRLLTAFDEAGLSLLFVKGVTVGKLAYGHFAVKAAVDIDLLVSSDEVASSADVLAAAGYELILPLRAATGRLERWHRIRKESVWRSEDGRFHLDLHTRLADHPGLIPSIGLSSPSQMVEVAKGVELPTLATDELFAYLCVHGASSLWFRLKWITDLAAILHPLEDAGIERLYRRSQELGAGRAAAQALLLADDLYGSLRGSPLGDELSSDRANRRLAEVALRQLAGTTEPSEPTEAFLGTARIHLSQLQLLPGPRFAVSEVVRQIRAAIA